MCNHQNINNFNKSKFNKRTLEMWYKVFVPGQVLLIPVMIMTAKGTHTSKNDTNSNSDVIVTYSNHAEAINDVRDRILVATENNTDTVTVSVSERTTCQDHESDLERDPGRTPKENSEVEEAPLQEDVVFIPNEKEVVRNEEYLHRDHLNIQDLMGSQKTVGDVLANKDVRLATDSPNTDIIFVMGKNNDNVEHPERQKPSRKWAYDDPKYKIDTTTPTPKLNCSNLNCNNAIKSICGGKVENGDWKYRLFLNDCYFRKVNCNFRSAINKYKKVALDRCQNFGAHSNQTQFSFRPPQKFDIKPVQVKNIIRSTSSRRSMTMSVDGQFCSHPCPSSCPQTYAPECAVSSTGRHRVFVNHCALDHNSCSFGIVWRSRPLTECVGGKKADMRQNAAFIGWMQRVGIVDNKGRLSLDD